MSFQTTRRPLGSGYIRVGDLTMVLGPNDVGKTTLLRLIRDELRGHGADGDAARAVFFCEFTRLEADFLVAHLIADVVVDAVEDESLDEQEQARRDLQAFWISVLGGDPLPGWRSQWPLGGWEPEKLDELELTEATREAYIAALQQAAPDDGVDRVALFAALRDSNLFAFEGHYDSAAEQRIWSVYWCVHSEVGQLTEVRRAIDDSGLADPQMSEFAPATVADGAQHLSAPLAPVLIAPLGRTALSILPSPLLVPAEFGALESDIEQLIGEICATARWDPVDHWHQQYGEGEPIDRETRDSWLEEQDASASVSGVAQGAAAALSNTATVLLPRAIRERYLIELIVRPISRWLTGRRVEVLARDPDATDSFPIVEAAAGLQPWFQLALLQAMDAMRRLKPLIDIKLDAWLAGRVELEDMKVTEEPADLAAFEWDSFEEAEADVAARQREWAELIDGITNGTLPDGVYPDLEPITAGMDPGVLLQHHRTFLGLTAARAYIFDEPEQHLHPLLQRQLAPWLGDLVWSGTAQAVISTHAVPFLNAGQAERASWAYMRRGEKGVSTVEPIDPARLNALSDVAGELGWDRGELLANTTVWLFVEGRADQAVLDTLIGSELHAHGVKVVPLHGESRASGILDVEILVRYNSAAIAVWLDRVPEEIVEELRSDPAAAIPLSTDRQQPQEVRTIAKVFAAANDRGRQVHAIPHPGDDLVDLLDEDVMGRLWPDFPGHKTARAEAEAAGATGQRRKTFYRETYGLPSEVRPLRDLAQAMVDSRAPLPGAVVRLLEICTRIAGSTSL